MTQQQREIVEYVPCAQEKIRILSGPGTGKTTTLEMVAQALLQREPEARILYAPFSKSVKVEARSKFHRNVQVLTIHALALRK